MSYRDTDRWIQRADEQREQQERRHRYDDAPGTPTPTPSYAEQERIWQEQNAWAAGYRDAYAGRPADPGARDRLSYASGRVEGEAARLAAAEECPF